MEEFFQQHPAIAYVLIGGLIGLVLFLIKTLITDNKAELKEVAEKSREIEKNYLHRFEEIKNSAESNHREIMRMIETVNVKLAIITEQVSAQKNIYEMVQRAKTIQREKDK
ncbi:MAG: hypothetical protein RBR74_06730 [Ignavibacteriaceae bacterium]|jgi:hypothetical protein|nr:hypothetical protein [Ignavibacteriaceae bacterium]